VSQPPEGPGIGRRGFLRSAAALCLAASPLRKLAAQEGTEAIALADGPRPLVRFPGKRELILVTSRPPHAETPFSVFNAGVITPNDAFYFRYHLADIPTSIDPATYRLAVLGAVKSALNLSLSELKSMPGQVEIVAVNQCSGNGRGYSSPRVFGAQLGNGSMGNARWTGVSLRSVLARAGVAAGAKQVVFGGLDKPVLPATPNFRKTLDIDHALSADPLLAWGMNGTELPFLNGYPLKLIVPGYFGTYWVKHLSDIEVLDHDFEGHDAFFMSTAYRVPDNACACVAPGTVPDKTRPISVLPVRSFITSVAPGTIIPAGRAVQLKGIAFDGGAGIKAVDVSLDGGQTWRSAALGPDLGRYSFRAWHLGATFARKGPATLLVRATNRTGEVQPLTLDWNPGGYRRHVVESTAVTIA
jgi:sulfite dehydrogenase (cytochrome) subunit A